MRIGITRIVVLVLCASVLVIAQVNKSNLVGVVQDTTGAVIPGVTVRLLNIGTGAVRSVTTDQTGLYRFTLVDYGRYRLEAQTVGFKSFARENIQLETGETARLDVTLEVGELTEEVTVTAEAPLLRSENATTGTTVNEKVIQELPLIGRNPYVFLTLSPGVQYYGSSGALNPWDNFGVSDFTGGGSEGRSEFLLDGMPNMRIDLVSFSPSPDAVSEMNVQTNAYDAEYGHSNASFVNVSTKGGTNEIHGTTYWYHRNDNLDANSFFNNLRGSPKGENKQNTYGVAVGGPAVRDKTHYHVTYEGTQVRGAGFVRAIVPTELERVGDFSQTADVRDTPYTIYDPATTRENPSGEGFIRDQFPNNVIPRDRQDAVALNSMEYYPHPNLARQPGNLENFENPRPSSRRWASLSTRADHQFNSNHNFFFRFGWNHRTDPAGPYYGECCSPAGNPTTGQDEFQRGNIAYGIGHTWLASPNTVIDFRFGATRYFDGNYMRGEGFDIADLGFPSSLASSVAFQTFPRYEMGGDVQNLGAGRTTARNFINQFNPLVNFHSQYRRHAIKYGFRYQIAQSNNFAPNRSGGFYRFDRVFTRGPDPTRNTTTGGHDIASFLLGTPSNGYVDIRASRAVQNKYWALYIQDDWKTNDRLTLNLGIRFEHEDGTTERYDRGNAGFDFGVANPVEAEAQANYALNPIPELDQLNAKGGLVFLNNNGIGREHLNTARLLYAPRLGMAYRINDRTVWRMGYGVYFAPNNVNNFRQDGFSLATRMITSLDGNLTPFHRLSDPFPNGLITPPGASGGLLTGVGQSVTSAAVGPDGVPNYKHGLTQQYSGGIQVVLPGDISFEANYVGNVAQRLTISRDLNAYPNEFLDLRTRLNDRVDNPFFGVIDDPTSSLSQPTTTVAQLLRPYPHFVGEGGVTDSVLPFGRSRYDSVQMQASKRFRNGFQFGVAYTISKLLESTSYLNANDVRPEKVISNADRPQRFVAHGLWELPFGQGKPWLNSANPVLSRIVGGWQVNWVITYQSMDAMSFPDAVRLHRSDDNPHTIQEYFDTSQFAPQEPFTLTYLSSRVADLRAPGIKTWDLTLVKRVPINERVNMRIQGEFYNAWNTTHFDQPNRTVTSGNFGVITGTRFPPRRIQLSARISF